MLDFPTTIFFPLFLTIRLKDESLAFPQSKAKTFQLPSGEAV